MMRVDLESRVFYVSFDADGHVANIYERRIYAEGEPWQSYYNHVFYNAKSYKHPARFRPNSLLRRLLNRAEEYNQCKTRS